MAHNIGITLKISIHSIQRYICGPVCVTEEPDKAPRSSSDCTLYSYLFWHLSSVPGPLAQSAERGADNAKVAKSTLTRSRQLLIISFNKIHIKSTNITPLRPFSSCFSFFNTKIILSISLLQRFEKLRSPVGLYIFATVMILVVVLFLNKQLL